MIFNYTKSEFSKRFTEEDLDGLSKSLERYIEKYYHYIRISEKERSSFAKIKHIQFLLATKQYDQLFDNPVTLIQTYEEMDKYD